MVVALLVLVLALVWVATTGVVSALNLLMGLLVAGVALFLLRERLPVRRAVRRQLQILDLTGFFIREVLVSTVRVGLLVLSPNPRRSLKPAIIAVPITLKSDIEITLLANLVTLTPGTLSVDVSEDRQRLYVHILMLESKDAAVADITHGFAARIAAVFA